MPLHFGRVSKTPPPQEEADAIVITTGSAPPTPTKKQTSPPKTPPHHASPTKISPLHIQIPDLEEDDRGPTSCPSVPIHPADLVLELRPPSPSSQPSSGASSPQVRRASGNKQSQMRGMSVMSYRIKQLVSKEKRRFDEDGFNLDLTYVTNRLIAFGYPAENLEGLYRNHYKDVYNFFERRHSGRYRIYNLCAERSYDKEKFHNRVVEFPFEDHCPPPLALFVPFCQDVDVWLSAHPENVAAIHCKAGKGRTGVMICAYMLYTRMWRTSFAAMEFFGAARSLKNEGVTIPSQRRFIQYFAAMCQSAKTENQSDPEAAKELAMKADEFYQLWEETMEGRGVSTRHDGGGGGGGELTLPPTSRLVLVGIQIKGVYAHKRIDPRVRIECGLAQAVMVYEPLAAFKTTSGGITQPRPSASPVSSASKDQQFWTTQEMELSCDRLLVWDEVKVSLRHRSGGKIGHFWFHTAFVPATEEGDSHVLVIAKEDIDKANKDAKKGHKQFAPEFSVSLLFELATPEDMAALRGSRRAHSTPDPVTTSPGSPGSPGSPSRLRQWASLNDKRSEGSMLQHLSLASPARLHAAPPLLMTGDGGAHSEADSSSGSVGVSPAVPPVTGSRSVPSSPKGFAMRFFSSRRQEASVGAAEPSAD